MEQMNDAMKTEIAIHVRKLEKRYLFDSNGNKVESFKE